MPRSPYTYITRPEQSNPAGGAPLHARGTPRKRSTSAPAWAPSPLPATAGSDTGTPVIDDPGTPVSEASTAGSCGNPSTTVAAWFTPVGCAARASPTSSCVPGARPSDGSDTYARSPTSPDPCRPGDTASCSATT